MIYSHCKNVALTFVNAAEKHVNMVADKLFCWETKTTVCSVAQTNDFIAVRLKMTFTVLRLDYSNTGTKNHNSTKSADLISNLRNVLVIYWSSVEDHYDHFLVLKDFFRFNVAIIIFWICKCSILAFKISIFTLTFNESEHCLNSNFTNNHI